MPKARMTTNAKFVSARIKSLSQTIDDNGRSIVPALAVGIVQDVTSDTPVDTTRARSGWNATKVAPSFVTHPILESRESTVARASSNMGRHSNEGFVSNGVPYIGVLDQGSSRQAPAGFVRAAAVRAILKLPGVRLLVPGDAQKLRN